MTALQGLRVVDASTLFAGAMAAMFLGDYGADVIKIEHPRRPRAGAGAGDRVRPEWTVCGPARLRHVGRGDVAAAGLVPRPQRQDAAIAPVYDVAGMMADPHYVAREVVTSVPDDELGKMQNVLARLLRSPGRIRWAGPPHGTHTDQILRDLGYGPSKIDTLRSDGVT